MTDTIDYASFPHSPAEGYRGDNRNFLTNALFHEQSTTPHIPARYTLSETEITVGDRVLPSARMIYLYSQGEHDAMKKMVGSYQQWMQLKTLKWFTDLLDLWQGEWYMKQELDSRNALRMHAWNKGGGASAKALFDEARNKGKGAGRPRKGPAVKTDRDTEPFNEDANRVVNFLANRNA